MKYETSGALSGATSASTKSEDAKPNAKPKSTKPREKRSAAALALKQILRMPLGELTKFANDLAGHRETAEFLQGKLNEALANGKQE